MGEALIRGFCKSGVSSVEQISVSVRRFDRQRALSAMGLRVYGDALEGGAADLAANSEIIFLGVRGPSVHRTRPINVSAKQTASATPSLVRLQPSLVQEMRAQGQLARPVKYNI